VPQAVEPSVLVRVVEAFGRRYDSSMKWGVWVLRSALVCAMGCGGKSGEPAPPAPAPASGPCGQPTLSNCPQDTLTDAGECPLPPLINAQGFYTVGCQVTAACTSGTQVCVCSAGPNGPEWGCAL